MKYRLIEGSLNDPEHIAQTVLLNRGVNDPEQYLSLTIGEPNYSQWRTLNNMTPAIELFHKHYSRRHPISILIDSDVDGFTSAAMLYQYIRRPDKDYPLHYILHKKAKAHGLAGDYDIPGDTKLLIIPDAGTNDCQQCNDLIASGIDVLILDHHQQDETELRNQAVVVNNQCSPEFLNKDLCGAGVVYKFLEGLDDFYWDDMAEDYIDLVALANIADSMDMRNLETRVYVERGLAQIKSELFLEMIQEQEYSMKGEITAHNVSWYVVPMFNALIRVGTMEEKDTMFRAFVGEKEDAVYVKRDGTHIMETIQMRACRYCKSCRSKQSKLANNLTAQLSAQAEQYSTDKILLLQSKHMEGGIVGLVAMRLADRLKKPTIVVQEIEGKPGVLGGSCRNYSHSPLSSLKELIDSTGEFNFCAGHDNAAGVQLQAENVASARAALNVLCKDLYFDSSYQCDFVFAPDELNGTFIYDMDKLKWLWATNIEEPIVAVCGLWLMPSDISVIGKNRDTIRFEDNGVTYVQFKVEEGNFLYDWGNSFEDGAMRRFVVVGTCRLNYYDGTVTPQFVIQDVAPAIEIGR